MEAIYALVFMLAIGAIWFFSIRWVIRKLRSRFASNKARGYQALVNTVDPTLTDAESSTTIWEFRYNGGTTPGSTRRVRIDGQAERFPATFSATDLDIMEARTFALEKCLELRDVSGAPLNAPELTLMELFGLELDKEIWFSHDMTEQYPLGPFSVDYSSMSGEARRHTICLAIGAMPADGGRFSAWVIEPMKELTFNTKGIDGIVGPRGKLTPDAFIRMASKQR